MHNGWWKSIESSRLEDAAGVSGLVNEHVVIKIYFIVFSVSDGPIVRSCSAMS